MNIRTHYKIHTVPLAIVLACALTVVAVLTVQRVSHFLSEQLTVLPLVTMAVASLGPIMFLVWYFSCFAEVQRGTLRMRWFWRVQRVDLRRLESAEIIGAGRGKAMIMRLEDSRGAQLWLPLTSWRDEDLLMARVLRATVDCRVKIDGDPMVVRRFAGVLDSYKSWDRQQAAA